jgi:penicillin-insensitive murein endopeptidase
MVVLLVLLGLIGLAGVAVLGSSAHPAPERPLVHVLNAEPPSVTAPAPSATQPQASPSMAALQLASRPAPLQNDGWDAAGSGNERVSAQSSAFFDRSAPSSTHAPAPLDAGDDFVHASFRTIDEKTPSQSIGGPTSGHLRNAAELPLAGFGYTVLTPGRRRNFGSDDLVKGLIDTAARLKRSDSEAPPLSIGDLSARNGGSVSDHASHENGRDVDLVFYWTDEQGKPVPSDAFVPFDAQGRGRHGAQKVRFDAARNWALVKTLLTSPIIGDQVEYLFVSEGVEHLLLRHARQAGEDPELIARARRVLAGPGPGAAPHDDHFHLRLKPVRPGRSERRGVEA